MPESMGDSVGRRFSQLPTYRKRRFRDSNIRKEYYDAIQGHSGQSEGDKYGRGFSLKVLKKAMGKLHYDIDLSHFRIGLMPSVSAILFGVKYLRSNSIVCLNLLWVNRKGPLWLGMSVGVLLKQVPLVDERSVYPGSFLQLFIGLIERTKSFIVTPWSGWHLFAKYNSPFSEVRLRS